MTKKFFIVLPYVVLAFVFIIIFVKKSEYKERERQYQESVAEYQRKARELDQRVEQLEAVISICRDSISVLEQTRKSLDARLQKLKKENEKTVAHIISSDTDWNIGFLSDYLSEENRF